MKYILLALTPLLLGFLLGNFTHGLPDRVQEAPSPSPNAFKTLPVPSPNAFKTLPVGEDDSPKMTRAQFKARFLGASSGELSNWSRPDSTQELGSTQLWYYEKKTIDPISGKVDYNAQVVIEGGRVVRINF